nr:period circadian protein [Drosophila takahashii]
MTLPVQPPKWILLMAILVLLGFSRLASASAKPQQFLLAEDLVTGTGTASGTGTGTGTGTATGNAADPLNDPSDLSAGLNFAPVGNLIAAAANAVPPAPIQFIRTAMNSGL